MAQQLVEEAVQPFIETSFDNLSFVIEQKGQTVGVAILEKCARSRELVDQFEIEEFLNVNRNDFQGQFVVLKRLVLNPLFETQARWVIEELLRIQGIDCLIYAHKEEAVSDKSTKSVAIRELVPVKRRKQ